MQSDETMAQGMRQESGEISASIDQRTTNLALSQGESRGSCAGLCESQQLLVLFLRKNN